MTEVKRSHSGVIVSHHEKFKIKKAPAIWRLAVDVSDVALVRTRENQNTTHTTSYRPGSHQNKHNELQRNTKHTMQHKYIAVNQRRSTRVSGLLSIMYKSLVCRKRIRNVCRIRSDSAINFHSYSYSIEFYDVGYSCYKNYGEVMS